MTDHLEPTRRPSPPPPSLSFYDEKDSDELRNLLPPRETVPADGAIPEKGSVKGSWGFDPKKIAEGATAHSQSDYLTATLSVYHTSPDQPVTEVSPEPIQRELTYREQPYTRRNIWVGSEEFTKLDLGWLKDNAGLIILERPPRQSAIQEGNQETNLVRIHNGNPLGKCNTGLILRAGGFQPLEFEHAPILRLICDEGEARVSLHVFPR